ncbi:hypothetical protein SX4_1803 [Vibrio mimicus SX-4]|nr:hypothetical protein SX4_1803 [Vibrio mimicus SX-4]
MRSPMANVFFAQNPTTRRYFYSAIEKTLDVLIAKCKYSV